MSTKSLWAAPPMSRPRWLRSPRGRLQEVPEVRGQALELVVREVQPAGAALLGETPYVGVSLQSSFAIFLRI